MEVFLFTDFPVSGTSHQPVAGHAGIAFEGLPTCHIGGREQFHHIFRLIKVGKVRIEHHFIFISDFRPFFKYLIRTKIARNG